jgi:hypothetical protein
MKDLAMLREAALVNYFFPILIVNSVAPIISKAATNRIMAEE